MVGPPDYERYNQSYDDILASADLSQLSGTSNSAFFGQPDEEDDQQLYDEVINAANLSQSYESSDSVLPGPLNCKSDFQVYHPGPASTQVLSSFGAGFNLPNSQQSLVHPGHLFTPLSSEGYSHSSGINQDLYTHLHSFAGTGDSLQPPPLNSTSKVHGSTGIPFQGTLSEQRSELQYFYSISSAGNDAPDTHGNTTISEGGQDSSQTVTFGLPTTDLYTDEDSTWFTNNSHDLVSNTPPTQSDPYNIPFTSADIDGFYHYSQSPNLSLSSVPHDAGPMNLTQGTSDLMPVLNSRPAASATNLPRVRTRRRRAAKRGRANQREKESVMKSGDQLLHKKESESQWRKFDICASQFHQLTCVQTLPYTTQTFAWSC